MHTVSPALLYAENRNKNIALIKVGKRPIEEGVSFVVAYAEIEAFRDAVHDGKGTAGVRELPVPSPSCWGPPRNPSKEAAFRGGAS